MTASAETELRRLLSIMERLRDPETGCPWDKVQDFNGIAPYTIEEAYEVADAISRRDFDALPDELGDLLFQVVYHARMAEEENRFGFEPEITAKVSKLDVVIYEVGISYYGRTYKEGKKIGWRDGFRALYAIIKYNLFQ